MRHRLARVLFGLLLCVAAMPAQAQVANPLTQYAWTQTLVATPAAATALLYKEYISAPTVATTTLTNDVCIATTPPVAGSADCKAPIPPKTVGTYTVTITATDTSQTPPAESAKSNGLTFTMQIVPATPGNLHLARLLERLYGVKVVRLASKRSFFHWKRSVLIGIVQP